MGAPKYRAPKPNKVLKQAPEASKEEVDKLTEKLKAELKNEDNVKKLSVLIAELLK